MGYVEKVGRFVCLTKCSKQGLLAQEAHGSQDEGGHDYECASK